MRVLQIIFALIVLSSLDLSCKKHNTTTTATTTAPSVDTSMAGNHEWSGEKYYFAYDSSSGHLVNDSLAIMFTSNIDVVNDTLIVIKAFLNYSYSDTLIVSYNDTIGKIIYFAGYQSFGSGTSFASVQDSLVYNYSNNSLYWYEVVINSINSSNMRVHSP